LRNRAAILRHYVKIFNGVNFSIAINENCLVNAADDDKVY